MVNDQKRTEVFDKYQNQTPNPPQQCSCRAQGDHSKILKPPLQLMTRDAARWTSLDFLSDYSKGIYWPFS